MQILTIKGEREMLLLQKFLVLVKFRKTVYFEMSFYNFRQISNLHFALPMAWGVVVGIPTSLIGMISSYDRWVTIALDMR